MDELNEKIKRVFSDLRIRCAYNMPSFWANSGKDYKVIPTKYAKGYQDALEDAEREITEVLSEQPERCEDTISRKAAIDAVLDRMNVEKHGRDAKPEEIQWTLEKLPSAQPEQSSEIQDILEYLDTVLHPIISPDHWNVYSELHDMISMLPSAQPEHRNHHRK